MPSQLFDIFTKASGIDDPTEREAYLAEACGNDAGLQAHVQGLLKSSEKVDETMMRPFAVLPRGQAQEQEKVEIEFPKTFGAYRLEGLIGQGGMGTIYRATQVELQRTVALKMVRNSQLATRQEIKRFYAEARSAAALDHPGIVPVIESGKVEDQHFFSMSYVDGIHLAELVKEHTVSFEQMVSLVSEITDAVQYAHERGVIHRDLKPENILISVRKVEPDSPDLYQAHITDFGLAKRSEHDAQLTIAGEILGTPGYMAPEQAEGDNDVNEAADIYAVGGLLYFLLTKHAPFEGKTVWDTLEKVRTSEPPRPRTIRPFIPQGLEVICLKCMEKVPAQRYASAAEISQDLENHRTGKPLLAKPSKPLTRFAKMCRRNPILTSVYLLGTLLVAALIFFPLKLRLSALELANQEEIAQASRRQSAQQEARNELIKAIQATHSGSYRQALIGFLKTAQLAEKSEDFATEESARWGIDSAMKRLWPKKAELLSFPIITSITTSDDGKTLAVAGREMDSPLQINNWGFEVFDLEKMISLHRETSSVEIPSLALRPNGDGLAVALGMEQVQLFKRSANTFSSHKTLTLRKKSITKNHQHTIGFLKDGETLYTCRWAPRISFWDFESGESLSKFASSSGDLTACALAEDANLLVASDAHNNIFLWNAVTAELMLGPVDVGFSASHITINPEGTHLVLSSKKDQLARLYDLSTWTQDTLKDPAYQTIERYGPDAMQLGRYTKHILYLDETGSLQYVDGEYREEHSAPIPRNIFEAFHLTKDEKTLIAADRHSPTITIWQTGPYWNHQIKTAQLSSGPIHTFGIDHPIWCEDQYRINCYPSPSEQLTRPHFFKTENYYAVKGNLIQTLSSKNSKSIYILSDFESEIILTNIEKEPILPRQKRRKLSLQSPVGLALNTSQSHLVCFSKKSSQQGPSLVSVIPLDLQSSMDYPLAISEITNAIASSSHREDAMIFTTALGEVITVETTSGKTIHQGPKFEDAIQAITTDFNRGLVALGFQSGRILIYKEDGWKRLQTVTHDNSISLLSFGNEGRLLISGGHSKSIKIWEIASGLTIGNDLTHSEKINGLNVCENTKSIITCTAEGELKVWPLPKLETRDLNQVANDVRTLYFIDTEE